MNASEKKDADDYYVSGERRQGITFYVILALILALIIILAAEAYRSLSSRGMEAFWSFAYLAASLAVGAVTGIILFNSFNSYRIIQAMLRNSLKASPHAFPEIYDKVGLAAERLRVRAPDTYISQSPAVNAYLVRLGLRKKVIIVNTGLLRAMDDDELLFILGHEISHAKYGRRRRIPGLGLPYVIAPQYNEYRCDRGGLVASRSIDASVRALLKLVTGREFIDRVSVKDLASEKGEMPSKVLQKMASHPMIGARIKELMKFYGSPAYTAYQNIQ